MHVLVGLRPTTACICSLYNFFCYQKQFFSFFIKGTVQRDFRPPFFYHSNQPEPLNNGLKQFRFWLSFHWVIRIFMNLPGVSYWAESNSPGYHTAQSQSPRGVILRRVNLPGVWYCAESISLGYDTAQSQSPRGIILRWVNLPEVSYPGESMQRALNQVLQIQLMLYLYNFPGRD